MVRTHERPPSLGCTAGTLPGVDALPAGSWVVAARFRTWPVAVAVANSGVGWCSSPPSAGCGGVDAAAASVVAGGRAVAWLLPPLGEAGVVLGGPSAAAAAWAYLGPSRGSEAVAAVGLGPDFGDRGEAGGEVSGVTSERETGLVVVGLAPSGSAMPSSSSRVGSLRCLGFGLSGLENTTAGRGLKPSSTVGSSASEMDWSDAGTMEPTELSGDLREMRWAVGDCGWGGVKRKSPVMSSVPRRVDMTTGERGLPSNEAWSASRPVSSFRTTSRISSRLDGKRSSVGSFRSISPSARSPDKVDRGTTSSSSAGRPGSCSSSDS